MINSCRDQA